MGEDRDKPAIEDAADAAGRVVVDGRDRNVWQWDGEQTDDTSILLKRLENEELEIEPTRRVPIQPAGSTGGGPGALNADDIDSGEAIEAGAESSFDPYNNSS